MLVTGSGLYLRGVWEQLSELPEVPEPIVVKVRSLSGRLGDPGLHRYLAAVDPVRAAALHPNDGSRIQRALALHLATGGRPSALLEGVPSAPPPGWKALLVLPEREAQRRRIAGRVAQQVVAGWPAEIRALLEAGHRDDLEALRPLGYLEWLAGGSEAAVVGRIVQATQAYAKRQSTYFRNQWPGLPTWDPDHEGPEAAMGKLGL